MGADELLVTTGGQQVIDLVCKTLIDPGDVIVAEGPDVSGRRADVLRLRGRRGADRDGCRRHADRRDGGDARPAGARGTHAQVRLHRSDVPEPCRGHDVARAAAAARPDRRAARAARPRGQPLRAAALLRRPAPAAVRARWRRVRDLPGHVLEDPLARTAPRLDGGAAAGAREAQPRQAGRGPLLLDVRAALRGRVLRPARLAGPPGLAPRALPPASRHAAGCARRAPAARDRMDPARGRDVHLGDPARLHRHVRPAGTRPARARRVRARARRIPRRPRRLLDAAELRRRVGGRPPRGRAPDRQDRQRAGAAVLDADRNRACHSRDARPRPRRRRTTRPAARVLPLRRRAGGER